MSVLDRGSTPQRRVQSEIGRTVPQLASNGNRKERPPVSVTGAEDGWVAPSPGARRTARGPAARTQRAAIRALPQAAPGSEPGERGLDVRERRSLGLPEQRRAQRGRLAFLVFALRQPAEVDCSGAGGRLEGNLGGGGPEVPQRPQEAQDRRRADPRREGGKPAPQLLEILGLRRQGGERAAVALGQAAARASQALRHRLRSRVARARERRLDGCRLRPSRWQPAGRALGRPAPSPPGAPPARGLGPRSGRPLRTSARVRLAGLDRAPAPSQGAAPSASAAHRFPAWPSSSHFRPSPPSRSRAGRDCARRAGAAW